MNLVGLFDRILSEMYEFWSIVFASDLTKVRLTRLRSVKVLSLYGPLAFHLLLLFIIALLSVSYVQ